MYGDLRLIMYIIVIIDSLKSYQLIEIENMKVNVRIGYPSYVYTGTVNKKLELWSPVNVKVWIVDNSTCVVRVC